MTTDFSAKQPQSPDVETVFCDDDGIAFLCPANFIFPGFKDFVLESRPLTCSFTQAIQQFNLFLDLAQRCLQDGAGSLTAGPEAEPPPRLFPWILKAHAAVSCRPVVQPAHKPSSYNRLACIPTREGLARFYWM